MNNGSTKRAPFDEKGKMKLDWGSLKRVLGYLKAYRARLFGVAVCIVVNAIAGVVGTMYLKTIIDRYITPVLKDAAAPDFAGLTGTILFMGALYLLGVAATYLQNRMMVTASQGTLKKIRNDLFSHMQTLPIRFFDTHKYGDLMSRYTSDTDTLEQMIMSTIPEVCSSAIRIASALTAMFITSVPLTFVSLLIVTLVMFLSRRIAGRSGRHFVGQQKALGELNGYIEEIVSGQKVVKVFCHEEKATEEFRKRNDALCREATNANKFANILMPIMGNLGHLQYVILAIVGGAIAVTTGGAALTLGAVASFLQLSKSFTNPLNQISGQINSFIMALAGAGRIFELMDAESETDDGYVTLANVNVSEDGTITECETKTGKWAWRHPHGNGEVTYTPLEGKVEFFDVDFGYNEEKIVLHNITMYAEPGQKVAFVGATGAGKTTITNLINRFYDIADGKIRYDGININKIRKSDLRRSLGMVLQDVNLFTGTVMDNIRYGRLDATDEECIAAAKLAGADGFIRMLPEGYSTEISGDGSDLSQGQRQLLSIARAAVADPPVMILDEATSSIDTRTEMIVQRGMDALMHGRTVFVIAHRLSTVKNSDVIMVLDHGVIIERGTHESLIAEGGQYYRLYTGAVELE